MLNLKAGTVPAVKMFTHNDIAQVENCALYFTPKVTYFQCLTGEHLFPFRPKINGNVEFKKQPSCGTTAGSSSTLFVELTEILVTRRITY